MFNKQIKEKHDIRDICGLGKPVRTKIIAYDHDSGEKLGEYENKILAPGSQMTACRMFGIEPVVNLPTYNEELNLENSLPPFPQTQPSNPPIVCLWAAGRSGAGSSDNEVNVVATTDRISPAVESDEFVFKDIIPFRWVAHNEDLDRDERDVYFGRKVYNQDMDSERIAYFFKTFDVEPQLHMRYLDGTEVTTSMYDIVSSQFVEVYVEMRLSVGKEDFRDYFDEVIGWDNANISTISLLYAWYDDTVSGEDYRWYQDILPYTKFNFSQEQLKDLNRAIDFNYQIYF